MGAHHSLRPPFAQNGENEGIFLVAFSRAHGLMKGHSDMHPHGLNMHTQALVKSNRTSIGPYPPWTPCRLLDMPEGYDAAPKFLEMCSLGEFNSIPRARCHKLKLCRLQYTPNDFNTPLFNQPAARSTPLPFTLRLYPPPKPRHD